MSTSRVLLEEQKLKICGYIHSETYSQINRGVVRAKSPHGTHVLLFYIISTRGSPSLRVSLSARATEKELSPRGCCLGLGHSQKRESS